ncbi:hypothetical protein GA0070624_5661 [Micromonospora rhizosphaerae]|uniref:Uncharacterized protein n=1 Tax=Micromonospora rhizosphaerae TaxID=568872 RepID=A0A1C6T5W8_9ACTN|nr:hypothetical protein [Micromonospora rhizosphaerae]SCL36825.1 hypothetical protein GA0070624_5661 [Micromonospora rhizosphaerae]
MPDVSLPTGRPRVPGTVLADQIGGWVGSAPLRTLVYRFGGAWPVGGLGEVLAELDEFSARHWDYRSGRERPDAREPAFDPETVRLVQDAAAALGLVRAVPPALPGYAHLVVLGGLAHACVRRVSYAAHLVRTGPRVTGEVALLGSFRPLSEVERAVLTAAGIADCDTEVEVLDAAVRLAFGLAAPSDEDGHDAGHPHHSWSSRTYRPAGLPPVRVLAAPSSEPDRRRAHTADTQRFWAEHVRLSPGDPVLVVTAPIYVPFQHCDALRTLAVPYGCGIETVGVDPTLVALARVPEPTLTPGRYLQEIRSAIRAMRALHASISAPAGPAS